MIADSTMEAKYIAMSEAAKKAFWYKKFIAELGVMPLDVVPLYYDNNGAIALAKEPRSHQKSKHTSSGDSTSSMITLRRDTSRSRESTP